MKEQFISKRFSSENQEMIERITEILGDYEGQGYRLSLRQLYYQLVARALIPNSERSYKHIGDLVSNARLAGLIDWDMIEDRGREVVAPPMWKNPAEIVEAAAKQFAIDRWKDQRNYVEVMVEKAALEGVLIPVCRDLGIRFTANRGYSSSSTMYEAGKRLEGYSEDKRIIILYLGDHDPSGIDMTRDVHERLSMFSWSKIEVRRLALNMDQIETLNPPKNPAKMTDTRANAYIAKFGNSSWELDAIEPTALARLVQKAVRELRDETQWQKALRLEDRMRKELKRFVNQYRKQHRDRGKSKK
jgi:hypothetical protein